MLTFLADFFTYPFTSARESNKFSQFLRFLGKDYPAYFWEKPGLKRLLVLPFLMLCVMIRGTNEIKSKQIKK